MKVIGGEYDIDFRKLHSDRSFSVRSGEYAYSSGRAALYYILRNAIAERGVKAVLVLDYLCDSILIPIERLGLELIVYPLNDALIPDFSRFTELYRKDAAILLINYFGLVDLSESKLLIRSIDAQAVIIEDDVQAYYEYEQALGIEDYKFTSLRKMFAVPDGGLVKSRSQLEVADTLNTFAQYKVAGALLKHERECFVTDDRLYLNLFEQGEDLIDVNMEAGMSEIARVLLASEDTKRIAQIRKQNYRALRAGIASLGIDSLIGNEREGATPLFLPIRIPNRNAIRRLLFDNGVFAPVHWPTNDERFGLGCRLAKEELSLIVDQRYTIEDMYHVLNILEDGLKK